MLREAPLQILQIFSGANMEPTWPPSGIYIFMSSSIPTLSQHGPPVASIFMSSSMGVFVNSLWLSPLISEHSRLSVSERRITGEFMNAQHPLNMTGASKSWQKIVIKLFPPAQSQSPTLWIT